MKRNKNKIAKIIYRWLILLLFISFALAAVVGINVQNYFWHRQTFTLLQEYIDDFERETDFDAYIKDYYGALFNDEVNEIGLSTYQDNERLQRILEANDGWFSEISLVDDRGIVINSTNPDMIDFDLRDSEYTAEYLTLLEKEEYFAKDFYPNPFEKYPGLKMAYAAHSFFDHSYIILMGFDEEAYRANLEDAFNNHMKNVRIGLSGYLISCYPDKSFIARSEILETEDESFSAENVLPTEVGETRETITGLYGKNSYVLAKRNRDYYLIAAYPVAEADRLRNRDNTVYVSLFLMVLGILFVVMIILMRDHVLMDVRDIHTSLKKITEGDLEEKVNVGSSLEFYDLSRGINETVDNLKERIKIAGEQMAKEMENARRIQESAVPKNFPEHEAFGIFASMNTAEAVGGDFYDFFMIGEERLAFVMADVAGKGMPAALYMMRAKTLIRTFAEQGLSIEEVAAETNRKLCEDASDAMFVTAWLGFLDLKNGLISYVHAGHTLPVLIGEDTHFVKQKINMVLGGLKKSKYTKQQITLKPGESLFLYTDGVTEAKAPSGDMYGEERLLKLIDHRGDEIKSYEGNDRCRAACRIIYEDVENFASGAAQYDDITMMWITYKGCIV